EYSVTFSSYFNVLWKEPRLTYSEKFTREVNNSSPETLIPVNLELVNELWLPNIFIYNLKTFKVVEVLSKHAGLWITSEKDILYSQATHITFICPMRFDAFPLDTQ
ncbi:Gammaaminobutyric acid receptor subunit deltalike, partial [Caligus rogercresseyi]